MKLHPNFIDAGGGGWARYAYWLLVILALSCLWATPRLPFVDLPQHAAQIASMRDIILGQYLWGDTTKVDLLTSYMTFYFPAILLTLFLPVHIALATVLSLAFLAYVWFALLLRRRFKAPAELDYLVLPAFFGATLQWGALNFTVATPICLAFVLVALNYAQQTTKRSTALLMVVGTLLYFSHVLMFLFACMIGLCLLLRHEKSMRQLVLRSAPYAVLGLWIILYVVHSSGRVMAGSGIEMHPFLLRYLLFFIHPFDGDFNEPYWLWMGLPFFAPLLLGMKFGNREPGAIIPFIALAGVWFTLPATFYGTYGIYPRYTIFTMAFYVLMFRQQAMSIWHRRVVILCMIAIVTPYFIVQHKRIADTAIENAGLEEVIEYLPSGKRVLALTFAKRSETFQMASSYLNSAAWYQAEKGGWVDFNFAYYHVMMVKLREPDLAPIGEELMFDPGLFNWRRHHGSSYDYFIIRSAPGVPWEINERLIKNGDCDVKLALTAKPYYVYQRRECGSEGLQ